VVASIDDIEAVGGLEGVFISNEFFDALPFRRLRWKSGEWREIFIDKKDDSLIEKENDIAQTGLPVFLTPLEDGQEIEVRPALDRWVDNWGAMLTRGYVLTVDYGCPRHELVVPHRKNGTWRGYFEHQLQTDALAHIGRQDLTAHVDFTHLVEAGRRVAWEPALFASQGIFLSHVGAAVWEKALAQEDPAARAKVSSALQQLLHPEAMGESFSVLLQAKEAAVPTRFRDIPNRIRRVV
jgi:SAM-dependent MidA family methyltransferase